MKNPNEIEETQLVNNQPDKPGETPVEPKKEIEKEKPTVPNRENPSTDPEKETPSRDPGKDAPVVRPKA